MGGFRGRRSCCRLGRRVQHRDNAVTLEAGHGQFVSRPVREGDVQRVGKVAALKPWRMVCIQSQLIKRPDQGFAREGPHEAGDSNKVRLTDGAGDAAAECRMGASPGAA